MTEAARELALAAPPPELARVPLVDNQRSPGWISDQVSALVEGRTPRWWWAAFVPSVLALLLLGAMVAYQVTTGVGVWGNNHPVMWGWDIINFVWWIGIGHAGTLISAILLLLRQRWRTAINRAAEAMTIFGVVCAAIYPALHVGRVWYDWWLLPIPTANGVWPQFRSPLIWDVFAVGTYFTVSVLFWYVGLIPDLAVLRDRARTKLRQILYGLFALGWTGSNRHWSHYEKAYLILAGLSTALVVSVHSIVSLDFAVSQLPGWHTTIFPPYFVAGAVFSGLGMVLTLVIPLRKLCRLEDVITRRHVDLLCKVTLATGWILIYAQGTEWLLAWPGGNPEERFALVNRATGPFAWAYWLMVLCNVVVLQAFWFRQVRQNLWLVWVVAILVNVGMWCERFGIIVTSLHREFLPANWGFYAPSWVDAGTYVGTFGLFFTCFLLFIRFLPMIAMSEVKGLTVQADPDQRLRDAGAADLRSAVSQLKSVGGGAGAGAVGYGMIAEFARPADALRAAERVQAAGFTRWDVYTPFPVRGMDRAMGLKNSSVGWPAFGGGVLGYAAGMLLIWFLNAVDYPILVGGKPMFSPFAAFPPAFELAILSAAFGVLLGMLWRNRLPRLHHPLLKSRRFRKGATHDKCYLAIECGDPRYSEPEVRRLLASAGSQDLELVEE